MNTLPHVSNPSILIVPTMMEVRDIRLSPHRFTYGRKKTTEIRSQVYAALASKRVKNIGDVVDVMGKDKKTYEQSVMDAHGVIAATLVRVGHRDLLDRLYGMLVRTVLSNVRLLIRVRTPETEQWYDQVASIPDTDILGFLRDNRDRIMHTATQLRYDTSLMRDVIAWIDSYDRATDLVSDLPPSKHHTLYTVPAAYTICFVNGHPYTDFVRLPVPVLEISRY